MPTLMTTPPLYRVRGSHSHDDRPSSTYNSSKRSSTINFNRPMSMVATTSHLQHHDHRDIDTSRHSSWRPSFATIATTAKAKDLLISAPIPIAGSGPRGYNTSTEAERVVIGGGPGSTNAVPGKGVIGSRREMPFAHGTVRHSVVGRMSGNEGMDGAHGRGRIEERHLRVPEVRGSGVRTSSTGRRRTFHEAEREAAVRRSWPQASPTYGKSDPRGRSSRNMNLKDLEIRVPPRHVGSRNVPVAIAVQSKDPRDSHVTIDSGVKRSHSMRNSENAPTSSVVSNSSSGSSTIRNSTSGSSRSSRQRNHGRGDGSSSTAVAHPLPLAATVSTATTSRTSSLRKSKLYHEGPEDLHIREITPPHAPTPPLSPGVPETPPPIVQAVRFDSTPLIIPNTSRPFTSSTEGSDNPSATSVDDGYRRHSSFCTIAKTCLVLPPLVAVLLADRAWRRVRRKKGPRRMREVPAVWKVLGLVG